MNNDDHKKISLGCGGEYSDVKQTRDIARNHFLRVVAEYCPEMARDLNTSVLPIYSQWVERAKTQPQYRPLSEGTIHPVFSSFLLIEKDAPVVARAIRQWSERYHLIGAIQPEPEWHGDQWPAAARADSLWPCTGALATLYAWHWLENGTKLAKLDPPGWPRTVWRTAFVPKAITLQILRFVANQQRRGFYLRAARKQFETILREDIAQQSVLAQAGGQRRTGRTYRPEHFTWLALRQVHGWSDQEIARWHQQTTHCNVECDAVRHGIRDTARLIHLTSRGAKRGRPAGKSGDRH